MARFSIVSRVVCASLLLLPAFSIDFSLAEEKLSKPTKHSATPGRITFNASCAGCHGLDGHGSDKAVNIAEGSEVQHLSDAQLSGIIANGVPGTGMPGFRNLSAKQIADVVRYLRSLQGKGQVQALTGNSQRGKEIFFGKAECSTCHAISGQGGFLGPDLSAYASSSSAKAIRDEIVRSRRNPAPGYRMAVLTTPEGSQLEGLIRNEDNFSIQFQTRDGSFHFFERSQLPKFERIETSLMPTKYSERLSAQEIDDLVSFLISACPSDGKTQPVHKKEYEDE